MNPMTFWAATLTLEVRVGFIRAYFTWLTAYQLRQAAALPYGALPEFIRREIQLALIERTHGIRFEVVS